MVINITYTDNELIDKLNRFCNETGRKPKVDDFLHNENFPSSATYINHFGSWANVLELLGFDVNRYTKYTNEFLLNKLIEFYKENNRSPTIQDFSHNANYPSPYIYIKRFGSWNNALKEVNLKTNKTKLNIDNICQLCGTTKTLKHWICKDGLIICNKCYSSKRNYLHGVLNPNSTQGVGVITEHVVSVVLKDCEKCNTAEHFNAKYDLISNKYKNINVKSSTLRKRIYDNIFHWNFRIKEVSKIPDYYICIGFNEDRSEILKVWIINNNSELITKYGIWISNSKIGLERATQYEVDATPYNNVYQNLDIYSLPEFRNLNNINTTNESINSLEIDTY